MFTIPSVRRSERAAFSQEEILKAFTQAEIMVLALHDDPYPYASAVNYAPLLKDNELYLIFHGAREGRRYELLHRNQHVSFFITLENNTKNTNDCSSTNYYASLAGDGDVFFAEDEENAFELLTALLEHQPKHLQPDGRLQKQPEINAADPVKPHSCTASDKLKASLPKWIKRTAVCALKVRTAALKAHPRSTMGNRDA